MGSQKGEAHSEMVKSVNAHRPPEVGFLCVFIIDYMAVSCVKCCSRNPFSINLEIWLIYHFVVLFFVLFDVDWFVGKQTEEI